MPGLFLEWSAEGSNGLELELYERHAPLDHEAIEEYDEANRAPKCPPGYHQPLLFQKDLGPSSSLNADPSSSPLLVAKISKALKGCRIRRPKDQIMHEKMLENQMLTALQRPSMMANASSVAVQQASPNQKIFLPERPSMARMGAFGNPSSGHRAK
ncbi:hypothetical protein V2G26_019567 [Clonostachys chloroleuca]